ncbi:MAG: sel1 repeat family protein [Duncaniella sp.]|nr:sel1 repeat family protein [Duncaniella sp.]
MIKYTNKYTDKSFDIAKCREWAESGYAPAQYQLGQCYEEGAGVERNLAKAFRLYWAASDNCRLAKERLNKDSYQGQLAKWLKKAVNGKQLSGTDLAQAQCMLGSCYRHGWGVECDMTSAVEWWQKAADLGDAYANYCLGDCYRRVAEDYSQAVRWYSRAVDFGGNAFPEAQRGLADCYASGHGVEQDWEKAADLYRQAAKNDDPESQYLLAQCYAEGHGVEQDMTEAVRLYKKAATYVNENTGYYGHARAMRCLGDCYANGDGVRKNAKQAAAWYAKAEGANI